MRMFLLLAVTGIGCAAAHSKPMAKSDLTLCKYVGERVYDPHNSILDVTSTMGPSEIVYYHHDDHTYRVVSGKLYSCPIG